MFSPFDTEANDYDKWYDTKLGAFVDKIQTNVVFELLEPKAGMKILDLGCGTGNYSNKLAKIGCQVCGLDISSAMLEKAKESSIVEGCKIDYSHYDGLNIEFDDDSFDAVVSVTAWEFIEDRERVLNEAMRVLKPGGALVIGTLHALGPWGELYNSDYFKTQTVFKYANLTTIHELSQYYSENFVCSSEALYLSPNVENDFINIETDADSKNKNRGGFICALWKK